MTKHIFRVPVDTIHFADTIAKGKSYSELQPFLTDVNKERLQALAATDGNFRYWGSKPGTSNVKLFDTMQEGDELLCYRGKKYIAVATIAYATINPALARHSWGEDKNHETWELVYFLRDVQLLSLETGVINEQWGMKAGHVMGFSKLADERAQPFINKYESVAKFLNQMENEKQVA